MRVWLGGLLFLVGLLDRLSCESLFADPMSFLRIIADEVLLVDASTERFI